jgi:hypothetical protein
MRVWIPILVLGVIGLITGGLLVVLHAHRTIGLGGIGLGGLLILVGVGGGILRGRSVRVEDRKTVVRTGQRGQARKAIIAVLVVILIGVGTFYGTTYLAGLQSGGQSPSTGNSGQSSQQISVATSNPSSTTTSVSGSITTFQPSTTSSSTAAASTTASTTISTSAQSSSGSSTIASTSSTTATSSVSTLTGTSSTSQQTQSLTQSTTASSDCLASTKSLDGSAINYNASGTSGVVSLTTHKASDVIVVFASAVSTPEGSNSVPPAVTQIEDGSGSLSFHYRDSFVTFVSDSFGNKFSEEEWYAIAATPLADDPITVTLASQTSVLTIIAFAVSGANTNSPFDPNLPVPVGVSGTTQGTISAAVSTDCSSDLIIGAAIDVDPLLGTGQGFTLIQSDGGSLQATGQDPIAEYILVSAPQTKLDVSFASESQPFTHTWLIIADAFN